jgi:predicted PolB exonuclease-like 3'-5' exonuclease
MRKYRPRFAIVFDLETIPDIEGARRVFDMPNATDVEVREAFPKNKDGECKFPKLPLHKVVCIGWLTAELKPEGWEVAAIHAPHIGEHSEASIITTFVNDVGTLRPKLISFNGTAFDLPVLRYRAMINRIEAPGFNMPQYFKRYGDDSVDLCDVLSSFNNNGRATLDEISKVLGLPGKPDGVNGSQVEKFVNEGRIGEVATYCKSDLLNTYLIWLRTELFCGAITIQQLEWSEAQAYHFAKQGGHMMRKAPPERVVDWNRVDGSGGVDNGS